MFDPGPPPFCDVCQRPVEKLERDEDRFLERVRFTARCHGDSEVVDVSERELVEMADGIKFGVAFKKASPLPTARVLTPK